MAAGASSLFVAGAAMTRGFPLDDAWIHLVYGREWATRGMLAYNAGIPATGETSPAWAGIAAVAEILGGPLGGPGGPVVALKLCGVAWHVAAAVLAAQAARRLSSSRTSAQLAAMGAGLLVACAPRAAYASASGMEVAMAGALLLATLVAALGARPVVAACCAGLAALARPECVVVVWPFVVLAVARSPRRGRVRVGAIAATVAILPVVVLAIRNLRVSGRWLPATFYAKQTLGLPLLPRWERGFTLELGALVVPPAPSLWLVIVVASTVGAAAIVRRPRRALVAFAPLRFWVALCALAYVLASLALTHVNLPSAFYFQRYVMPPLALLVVTAASTFASIVGRARPIPAWRMGLVVLPMLVSWVLELGGLAEQRADYASDVDAIDAVQGAIGRYVDQSLARDAVVWSVDAGAIRYQGNRRTVDLMGLNTPELVRDVRVKKAFWPDAVVFVPSIFEVMALPGLLETALVARAPGDRGPIERSPATQVVLRCVGGAPEGSDNRVGVSAAGRAIAVGRCVRPRGN